MPERILGRDWELTAATELLSTLEHGPAALVFAGEAGIGKTTLWREAVERARWGGPAVVLTASPAHAEASLGFAALADILEPVVEELLPQLSDPQRHALNCALLREDPGFRHLDQRAVAAGVLSVFRALAQRGPLLLALDDLQWLDRPSARVLGYAIRRARGLPLGVIACERLDKPHDAPLDLRSALPERRFTQMALGPLSLGALHQLLKERLGRPFPRRTMIRIEQLAGGNPFFALELGRALRDDPPSRASALPIPRNLSQLVEGRIAILPKSTRTMLLAAAALAAPTVELVGLATRTPASTTRRALERATETGLVGLEAAQVRFTHPLYAAVAYSSATARERRMVHARLAHVTEEIEERGRHSALSAEGADEQVAALVEAAAEHARSRGAPETAADLADHARVLTPHDHFESMQRRSIRAAEYRFHAGDLQQARLLLDSVLRDAPTGHLRAEALRLLGEIRYHENSFVEAIDLFEAALENVGDDAPARAAIETHLTYSLNASGDWPRAARHAHRAVELAETNSEPWILAEALAVFAIADFLVGRGIDRTKLTRALELEDTQRQTAVEMRPSLVAACLALYTGELRRSIEILSSLRARSLERGADSDLVYVAGNLAWAESWRGNLSTAAGYADEAIETAMRIESDPACCFALAFGAVVAANAGDRGLTCSRAQQACKLASKTGYGIAIMFAAWARGALELAHGDASAVDAVLGPLVTMVEREGLWEPVRAPFLADAIEALIVLGEVERAERLTSTLEDAGTHLERQWTMVQAARCRALVAAARGDLDAASRAANQAIALADGLELRLEAARTLLVAGSIERRRRRKRAANELLGASLEMFEQAGAHVWADKARGELERVGIRRGAVRGLSTTERRVAELTASGLTNRKVAAALFISPKTVEANLAHVYDKLGIRSRAELGAKLTAVARTPDEE